MSPPRGGPSGLTIFGLLLAFRIVNALSIKTFFQPDEYFQSLEPAWRIAFGADSGAWTTWEWREGLRTALHPWIFALVYKVADAMSTLEGASRAGRAEDLLIAPKIAQAVFAAGVDFYTWRLGQTIYGASSSAATATLLLTIFSPWQFFTSTRTFANSFETTLTVLALYNWPWKWFLNAPSDGSSKRNVKGDASVELKDFLEGKNVEPSNPTTRTEGGSNSSAPSWRLHIALAAAALACILRPTNIIIWATIASAIVIRYSNAARSFVLLRNAVVVGSIILTISLLVDGHFYNRWTIPPLRFLYLNIMQDLAIFYGQNRPDYYFTEGLPLLLTTALPFAALGLFQTLRPRPDRPHFPGYVQRQTLHILALAVTTTTLAFSLIAHKETRFISPLLPLLHLLAAAPLANFFRPFPLPRSHFKLLLLLLGVTFNVLLAAYVSTVHQRGVVDVTHWLRHEAETEAEGVRNTSVAFLMPCHSTPWRSHLVHAEIDAWALTCEPPVDVPRGERERYLDEADVFYMYPGGWIDNNMQDRKSVFVDSPLELDGGEVEQDRRRPWPEYLVFFEHLEPVMNAVLEGTRYEECWRGFNSHWHDDWRRRGNVVVRCLR